ncbi:hypothetical protein [Pseudomonas aeruginosa]|uniref:hypothetical protein n=1 Tax=Pseudomonas aeruginosa TaxID=287 RepID=UPI000F7ECEAC|nr:hypothetical protein [Pseudomonas aeruginosa]RTB44138.1 hypothetical protein EJ655_08350 [Pseudomonas aeruginosa]
MSNDIQPLRLRGRRPAKNTAGQAAQLPRLHALTCDGTLLKTSRPPYDAKPASRSIPLRGARRIEDCIKLAESFARHQPRPTDAGIFVPLFIELSDEAGRLVLCGQVLSRVIDWCPPVQTAAEARLVQARCMRLSEEILYQDNLDSIDSFPDDFSALDRLCDCHSAWNGRLVDPLWRIETGKVLRRLEMRRMRAMRSSTMVAESLRTGEQDM